METQPDHYNNGAYVITHDLGERIKSFRFLGLQTPEADDTFFTDFHTKVKKMIASALPAVNVITYDMQDLAEQIWTEAIRIQKGIKDAVVLSSCAEVAAPRRGHTIEVNRIVDTNGNIIGIGPRPANSSIQNQISSIASVTRGNPVVLVEDGMFTGATAEFLLQELAKAGIPVIALVVGICFPRAKERVQKVFDGDIIVIDTENSPYEWMPDHDFVPFTPNCGRVFGGKFGNDVLPHYTHNGFSYCFPYILPFGDPVKWASIPHEYAGHLSFMCLEETLTLFKELDEMNKKRITPLDLMKSIPRVSAPVEKGSGQLPNIGVPITETLSEICHEMS